MDDRQPHKSENNSNKAKGADNADRPDQNGESGPEEPSLGKSFVTWANAGVIGMHMVSGPLLGGFLGFYLDKWLDTKPVCIFIGLALGLVAGGLNMFRDVRRLLREQAADEAREKMRRMGLDEAAASGRREGEPQTPDKQAGRKAPDDDDEDD